MAAQVATPKPVAPRQLVLFWRFGILPNARETLLESIKGWTDRENKIVAEIQVEDGSDDWRTQLAARSGCTVLVPSLDHICGDRASVKERVVRLRLFHQMGLTVYSIAEPTLVVVAAKDPQGRFKPVPVLDAMEYVLNQQFANQSVARTTGQSPSGRPRKCECGHERTDHPDGGPCHRCGCGTYRPRAVKR